MNYHAIILQELHIASNWDLSELKKVVASMIGYLHRLSSFSIVEQKSGVPLNDDFFFSLQSGVSIAVVIKTI